MSGSLLRVLSDLFLFLLCLEEHKLLQAQQETLRKERKENFPMKREWICESCDLRVVVSQAREVAIYDRDKGQLFAGQHTDCQRAIFRSWRLGPRLRASLVVNPPRVAGEASCECTEILYLSIWTPEELIAYLVVNSQAPPIWKGLADHSVKGRRQLYQLVASGRRSEYLRWHRRYGDKVKGFTERHERQAQRELARV